MFYEDKSKTAYGTSDKETGRTLEFVPIIIPKMEMPLVFGKLINKGLPVFHNVFAFMAINIHTVLMSSIPPPQLA